MAVPSSGAISLAKLALEKRYDDYNSSSSNINLCDGTAAVSLSDLVNGTNTQGSCGVTWEATNTSSPSYPNTSTPHSMSEWYSYDHDASSVTSYSSSSAVSKSVFACSATVNQTYYHDGSGTYPVVNDTCYSDSNGSSALGSGHYKTGGGYRIELNSSGVVTSSNICL